MNGFNLNSRAVYIKNHNVKNDNPTTNLTTLFVKIYYLSEQNSSQMIVLWPPQFKEKNKTKRITANR